MNEDVFFKDSGGKSNVTATRLLQDVQKLRPSGSEPASTSPSGNTGITVFALFCRIASSKAGPDVGHRQEGEERLH